CNAPSHLTTLQFQSVIKKKKNPHSTYILPGGSFRKNKLLPLLMLPWNEEKTEEVFSGGWWLQHTCYQTANSQHCTLEFGSKKKFDVLLCFKGTVSVTPSEKPLKYTE
ncbi:hypothetical protein FQN60_017389, partial [Etheostoma spectabile]